MIRKLFVLLILEILVGANAGITFNLVESRYIAALWTGSVFLILGLSILYWTSKNLPYKTTPLFWVAVAHTFIFSIPILFTRVLTFSDEPLVSVLGFDAMVMHKAASTCFFLLVGATLFELIRQLSRLKAKKPQT